MNANLQAQIAMQEQNLSRAKETNDQEAQMTSWDKLGHLYSNLLDYPQSVHAYEQAADIAKQLQDANLLFRIGISLSVLHEYPQAIDSLKQSIQINLSQPDNERSALRVISFLADLYATFLDDFPQAIAYYQQVLELAQKTNSTNHQNWTLRHLGECSEKLGDTEQAIHYYEQGLEVARLANNKSEEITLLTSIANLFAKAGNQQQMTAYLVQALSTALVSGEQDQICSVLIWWGNAFREQDNLVESARYYHQALALAQQNSDITNISSCLGLLARLSQKQGKLHEAIGLYQQDVQLLTEDRLKSPENHRGAILHFSFTNALESLGELFEEIGDSPKALDYLEQALANTTIRSSVQNLNEHIARLRQKLNANEADAK